MPANATVSCSHAAFEEGFAHRVQPRQLAALLEFGNFINRIEHRAAQRTGAAGAAPTC